MKEIDHQTNIKLSVIAQGGFSMKLSNRFTVGVPDLVIMLWPFAPCFAEVKDLKEVVDDFDLKLAVSPKQNHTIKRMNQGCIDPSNWHKKRIAFLLVVAKWRGIHIIAPLPQGVDRLSARLMQEGVTFWKRLPGHGENPPSYAMEPLLTAIGVPRL